MAFPKKDTLGIVQFLQYRIIISGEYNFIKTIFCENYKFIHSFMRIYKKSMDQGLKF